MGRKLCGEGGVRRENSSSTPRKIVCARGQMDVCVCASRREREGSIFLFMEDADFLME